MNRVSTLKSVRSKKLYEKKRKLLFYKVGGTLVVIIVVVLLSSLLTKAGFLRIQAIEVVGNKIVLKEAIQELVTSELAASYLALFSKNNRFLFPQDDAEEKISSEFSAIKNVALSFNGLKRIEIEVEEYEPEYLWCDSVARTHCYFMDPNGYVFNEAADFSSNVLFTYYGLVDPASPVGTVYLPKEQFNTLNSFVDSLKLLRLEPVGILARGEDDFELILSTGGRILFTNREDYMVMFENLETIIAEQTRQDKNFLDHFEYIDVRFNTKAFIKTRNDGSDEAVE